MQPSNREIETSMASTKTASRPQPIFPVILAGGRGERFWPYSNSEHPKQLLPLVTKKTMLEDTLDHVKGFRKGLLTHLIISGNLEAPVNRLLRGRKDVVAVAEPASRNTAAAIALACRLIQRSNPEGVMLVLTADHALAPDAEFNRAMAAACRLAEKGESLVTFGIKPTRPEVGYGYVEAEGKGDKVEGLKTWTVRQFHEKPDAATARKYLESGRFFWNSGMFAWRVDYLWEQFAAFQPEIHRLFEKAGPLDPGSPRFKTQLGKIYKTLPEVSIDYGIMEKAPSIQMVIPEFEWDDIGAWAALDRRLAPDAQGNRAKGEALALDCEGSTFFADDGLIAAFGLKNVLVVRHGGVTLVLDKSKGPQIKELVKKVQANPKYRKFL